MLADHSPEQFLATEAPPPRRPWVGALQKALRLRPDQAQSLLKETNAVDSAQMSAELPRSDGSSVHSKDGSLQIAARKSLSGLEEVGSGTTLSTHDLPRECSECLFSLRVNRSDRN